MKLNRLFTAALTVALLSSAYALQDAWKRYYVGESALSLEAPLSLGAPATEEINDADDWVAKMTDYAVESETHYLQITVFEGKSDVKANHKKLSEVIGDTIELFTSDAFTVKFDPSADGKSGKISLAPVKGKTAKEPIKVVESKVGMTDGAPSIMLKVTLGEGREESSIQCMMIGEGNTVYAIYGVGHPTVKGSVDNVDRIMKSVRFSKDL